MDKPIGDIRREYAAAALTESSAGHDPIALFQIWLADAIAAGAPEPTGMTLATVDAAGRPSARVVLLKGVDPRGFTFFTNYDSSKALELLANPRAALCFWWSALERQVRVEGTVARVSAEESDAYFATRPRASQLGAAASPQSREVASREELEQCLLQVTRLYEGGPVPRPPGWGGYRLAPEAIEFWQGRPARLHDRLRYSRAGKAWKRVRLAP